MKKIKITEAQFNRLLEANYYLSDNDFPTYSGSETITNPVMKDANGNDTFSEPTQTDDLSTKLSPQNWRTTSNYGPKVAP